MPPTKRRREPERLKARTKTSKVRASNSRVLLCLAAFMRVQARDGSQGATERPADSTNVLKIQENARIAKLSQ
jgi:hypothetical protein